MDHKKRAEVVIGKRLLEGNRDLKLDKPLMVLKRQSDGSYKMVATVNKKALFRSRPTPISPKSKKQKILPNESPMDVKPKILELKKYM